MNKNLLLLLTLFVGFAGNAQNTQSFSKSSLIIDGNPLDITGVSGGLGTFNCNTTIGFETVVQQCGTCNASNASMAFRVYKIGGTPSDFIAISAPFDFEITDGSCKNRTFGNGDIKSLLLQNLENGDYNLDFYFLSNGEGCDISNLQSVTYSTTFTYAKEPSIVFQPIDLVNCLGQDMFFKAEATGSGTIAYQWERSDNGAAFEPFPFASSTHIKGGLSSTLQIDDSKAGDHNDTFRCKITGENGCFVYTRAASAFVSRKRSIISTENTACEGGSNLLTSRILAGTVNSYQWEYEDNITLGFIDLSDNEIFTGTTTAELKISSMPKSISRYQVKMYFNTVEINDDGSAVAGTCILKEDETFTINPRPAKPTAIPDIVRCGTGIIELVAPLEAAGYRWYTDTTQAAVSTDKTYSPNLTATQKLYFGYLSAESCESFRTEFTATINPIPTITLGSIADICPGVTSVTLPFTNLADADLYSITSVDATGFSAITYALIPSSPITLTLPETLTSGTYNFVLKLKNATTDCESLDIPFTVRAKAATEITAQPIESEVAVCKGEMVTFTIAATGEGVLILKWLKDGMDITGENNPTLTFAAAPEDNAKKFTCKVTGECGEVISSEIMLTVNAKTVIFQQPQNASECEGNSATFTVSAAGEGTLNYQWKKNGVDVGMNSNTLTISNLQSSDNNAEITCVITSDKCDGLTSDVATLTVTPPPNAPAVTSPAGFCNDEAATALTATPTNGNSLLWWGNDASGGTSDVNAPLPITTTVGSAKYYVSQKDVNGCEGSRAEIEVVVSAPVTAEISAIKTSICATGVLNNSAILEAIPSGGNGDFSYQWSDGQGVIANENAKTLTLNTADTYAVEVVSGFCSVIENQVISPILPELITAPAAADVSICFQETATLTATSNFTDGSFRWYDTVDGSTTFSSDNSLILSDLIESRTVFVAYQKMAENTACETPRRTVSVTVSPQLLISSQPQNVTKCEGNTANFSATITNATTYQWQRKLPNGNFENISGETTTDLRISSIGNSANPHLTIYRLIASSGECSVTTDEATLFVNSKDANLDSQTACFGSDVTFSVPATTGIIQSYEWQKRTGSSGSFEAIAGKTAKDLLIENVGIAEDNTYYRCRLVFDNGDGSTCTITTDDGRLTVKQVSVSLAKEDVKCFGESTGSITATASGSSNYEYQLNSGPFQTSNKFENLGVGTYTLNVKDGDGCTATENIEISQPLNQLSVALTKVDVTCSGGTGSINSLAAGGTPPYTYKLNDGVFQVSGDFTDLTADTYSITAKDANGCEKLETIAVTALASIVISNVATTAASCSVADGSVTFDASGGNGALKFKLDNGSFQTTSVFNNLAAGNYVITVQDATNCEISQVVAVGGNAIPVVTSQPQNVTKCEGNTAYFSATITNATTYQWQRKLPAGTFENISGENSAELRISSIGNAANPHLTKYRLIASSGECSVTTDEVTLFVNSKDENLDSQTACFGSDVTFSVPETTGIIQSYEWQKRTGSSGLFEAIAGKTAKDLLIENVGIAEDNSYYRCRLVFDNGDGSTCTITTDDGRLTVKQVSVSLAKEDVKCFGESTGSITATASGSSNYEYQLNSGPFQTSNKFENLGVGTYTLNVKDGDGCTATENIEISQPLNQLSVALTKVDVTCSGGNGSINALAAGGTSPYTYKLNEGVFQTSGDFTDLTADTYKVTVKDANGCEKSQNSTIEATISIVISNVATTPASCSVADGSITFDASGGNGALKFKLDNGSFQTTSAFNNLAAGNYTITVQDATNCEISQVVAVGGEATPTVDIQPQNVTKCEGNTADFTAIIINATTYQWQRKLLNGNFENISGETTTDLCISSIGNSTNPHLTKYRLIASNGECSVTTDEATLFVNSKHENLDSQTACLDSDVTFSVPATTGIIQSYEWQKRTGSSGSFVAIAGKTAKDLLIENVGIAEDNTYYRCRLVFDNGDGSTCTITTDDGRLTVKQVSVSLATEDIKCFGESTGSITATASGSSNYEYQLNSGVFQSSNKFENLGVGTYTLNVKDGDGCTATENIEISQPLNQLSVALTKVDVTCSGGNGSINSLAAGGTSPYTYKLNEGIFQVSGDFTDLTADTYSITAKDANGCEKSQDVIIEALVSIVISNVATTAASCSAADGSVTFDASGGNGALKFKLDNGSFQATSAFNNLAAGNYTITVQDATNCEISQVVAVGGNAIPVVTSQPQNVTKCEGNTADFTAIIIDATTYQWQRKLPGGVFENMLNETGSDLRISSIGNSANPHLTIYRLIASSGECSVTTDEATLFVNSKDANLDSQTACFGSDVTFSVPATTGIIQSYEWQKRTGSSGSFVAIGGKTTKDLLIENVGIAEDNTYYRCRLVFDTGDGSTCTITTDDGRLTVKQVSVSLSKDDVKCFGESTGSIRATASGSSNYEYQLNSGVFQSSNKFENLGVGTYTLNVKDGDGCTATGNIEISQPLNQLSVALTKVAVTCSGGNGSINSLAAGGTPPYTYKLNDGVFQASGDFTDLTADTYSITAKDANGCEKSQDVIIEALVSIVISNVATTPASCSVADGSITFDASGGNGALKFKLDNGSFQTTSAFNNLAAGNYTITVQDATNCEISQVVAVGGNAIPVVTSQPQNVTKCEGNTADFTATIITATTYQWQRKLPNGNFENISGETTTDLRISSIGNSINPHLTIYRLIASNDACSVTTDEVTLFVNSKDSNLDSQTACLGSDVTFSVPATTGIIQSYEWQKRTGSSGSFEAIAGKTAKDLLIENVRIAEDNTYYRCRLVFDNGNGSTCTITTDDGRLTVKQVSVSLTEEDVKCFGESTGGIIATASGSSNYAYQLGSGDFQISSKFKNLASGNFTVNVKDGDGCTATGNSTISAPAIIAISNLTTVPATCDGAIGSISFIASGGTGALKFKLGSGAFQTSSTFSNLSGGSYILTVQDENGCLITQNNIVVGGKAVPVISAQPTDFTNCEGNTASFEITASNVTSYQWQQQLPGGTFTNISGENTNELRLSNVGNSTSPHLANYRVTLQNDGCEITSEAATLTVNSIAGSNEDKTLCLGSDYTLDLANYTLTGTVSGYQWQYRNGTSGSWTDLANGTNYVFTISNFQTSNSGYYRCRVTFENSSGTCIEYIETGNGLKLDVIENSPPIINTDQTQICGTGSATITATGCVGIVTWSTGETGTSISVASAGSYTAVCSLDNCESAVSNTIEIAIGTAPTTPTITADTLFLCNAEMATLTAINCNGIVTWSTAATGATLMVGKGSYYAICETPCGTSSASNEVIIEGNALPTSGTIEATAAINCAGYNPPTITNSVSPAGESLTIQWQQRITSGDWADIDGATSLTYNPSALSETTLYRRRVSNTCGEAFSNVDTIYIAPDPSVIVTSSKSLICSNETFILNATVNGGSGNCPISWQRNDRSSAAGSSFWEDISGTAESLTINNLSNASTENVSVYYRVVVDCQPTSCNKATADAFEIIVQPSFEFDLNFTDSTICEGNTAIITATGCGGVISWSSGESTSSVTVSPTASTNYMATCSNSCGSSSQMAGVIVLPGGVPLPENLTVSGVVTPAVLTFAASGTSLKWYSVETGGTASLTPPSFSEVGKYTVWVTQNDGRCESNRLKITAAVYSPLALLSQSIDQYDCKGNSVTLFVEAVGAGNLQYQWQRKRPNENVFINLTENDGVAFSYGPVMRVSGVGNANNPHLSQYRCFVWDSLGTTYSNINTLFVNSLEGTFKNVDACIGTNYEEDIAIKFVITGDVSEYQWQTRSGTSGPWNDMINTDRISGTNTSRLKISPLEYTDGRYYRCGVTFNTGGPSCTENTDPSRLDVSGYPNAPLGSTVEYCQFDRASSLSYDTRSSNDVLWYSSENQVVGDTKAPIPETNEAGEFPVFFTEATPQGCESPKVKMNVIIHPEPIAPTNTTPLFVKEGTILQFTAEGENLKWFTSRTGRTYTSETPTYTDPKLYKHYVSQTSAFGCESERTYIESEIREVLKFTRLPEAQADCDGNSVTFDAAAKSFSDVTFQWESKLPNAESFVKISGETERGLTIRDVGEGENPDGTLYRCLIKDAEDSLYSSPVPLIVNKVVGEIPDVAACTGQLIVLDSTQIQASGLIERFEWQRQLGRTWETIDSTSTWLNLGIADSSKTADYRLKVVFKVNDRLTCNRYSPETKVVVNAVPAAPVTTDYTVCKFSEQRLKVDPQEKGNQVLWFTSLTDTLGQIEPPQNLSETVGKETLFVAERSDKGCESDRTALNFTTLAPPQKPVTDSLLSICQFSSTVNLTAISQNTLLWSIETTDDFAEEIPAISTQLIGTQQYFVAAVDSNGCLSENQKIAVNIAPCIISKTDVNPSSCNEIIRENVNGNSWVNFYNSEGKLFGAINPNGQNLGTVTLNFQLANNNLETPEGTTLFPRYFAMKSSVLEKFERLVKIRILAPKNEIALLNATQNWFVIHYEGINEDCDPLNNDNFTNGRSEVIDGKVKVENLISEIDFFEFSTASFSEFGLTPNPFAQIETEALIAGNQVNISLNITEEVRPLNYFIERSIDGKNWFAWRQIKSGESKQLVDIQPFNGIFYYRSVYQDLDGTLKYFAPVAVNFEITEPTCTVFPNPVIESQALNLYIRNLEPVTFEFFDVMLRKWGVAARRTEPNNYELTLSSSMVQGTYFIRAIDAEDKSCVVKIVKR